MAKERERRSGDALKETKRRVMRLLKTHGVSEVAKIMDMPYLNVWQIKHGLTYANVDSSVTVNSLGLMKSSGKNCRRCGDKPRIIAKSLLCIQCELEEREKIDEVTIAEYCNE